MIKYEKELFSISHYMREDIKQKIKGFRTWIEADIGALAHNLLFLRDIVGPDVKIMAVVKSNAYGHGLIDFVKGIKKAQSGGEMVDWFGVDTYPEAMALRRAGIKEPILVLGYTLPEFFKEAARENISLSVSTFESFKFLKDVKRRPKIHLKFDTGMHRQGFFLSQAAKVISALKKNNLSKFVEGIFSHFAAADNFEYSQKQIENFENVTRKFAKAGFADVLKHMSATGGVLLHKNARFDMVRPGCGLYGYWPSEKAEKFFEEDPSTRPAGAGLAQGIISKDFRPVLSWKAIISEIKRVPKGSYIGYDLTEKVACPKNIAILPVGYWHGVDRGLSGKPARRSLGGGGGEVLIRGKRCKILGRVSMDMIVVDVSGVPCKVFDEAVLIGRQGKEEITAYEWAKKLGTSHYEIITRINPRIQKFYA